MINDKMGPMPSLRSWLAKYVTEAPTWQFTPELNKNLNDCYYYYTAEKYF